MALAFSYSAVKDFENCPRKYHETRILKKFKQPDTTSTLYGTAVHKAFEDFIGSGTPFPPQFAQFQQFAEPLTRIDGEVHVERKMGIRADFTTCDFFAKDVWFRAIPDLLIVNKETGVARIVDYKTGKSSRYADTSQLELLAAMTMSYHPEVTVVRGALLFIVANAVVKASYTREQLADIYARWGGRANAIEAALELNVWNPRSGPLCGFCPVATCPHHK
jgi:CRISPR/Cas system-associated exonuclease Cas4 (RecB family)